MLRAALLAFLLASCKDDPKVEPRESAARNQMPSAPEPPGSPSCAEVGAHLMQRSDLPEAFRGKSKKVETKMTEQEIKRVMLDGLVDFCRLAEWSQETRACAMSWHGQVFRERADLVRKCPGVDRNAIQRSHSTSSP